MHCNNLVFAMIQAVQGAFCERAGRVLLINVPAVFRVGWWVIKPWLDQRTAALVELHGGELPPSLVVSSK